MGPHGGSPTISAASARTEWKKGWTVVLAAFFGVSIVAIQTHTLGVLIKPLSEAFGWSRAEISVGPLIVSAGMLIVSPLMGTLIDRFGARRTALCGVPIFAAVLAAVSLNNGNLLMFYGCFALLAIVGPAVGPITWSLGVASRFKVHRGLALGIAMAGMSALGSVSPIFAVLAYEHLGIHLVWVALGVLAIVVGYPLTILLFYDANDLRTASARPEARHRRGHEAPSAERHGGSSFQEALKSRHFWQMAIALSIAASVCGFFAIHFAAMLTDRGMGAREAALVMGTMAPATMTGRIAGGYLLDRFFAPRVAAVMLLLPLAACLIMLIPNPSIVTGIAVGLAVGFALGSEGDVVAYLAARYFGLANYGKIYGLLLGLYGLGFGLGSFIGGSIFVATGSYRAACLFFLAALPVAITLLATLGRYRTFEVERDARSPAGQPA